MSYVTLKDDNFNKEVIEATELVLVDFWAPWCAPCRQLAPTIEAIASEYKGKIKVGKVNVDEAQLSASRYGVKSIPTVIMFKGGKVLQAIVGVQSRDYYVKLIEANS